MFRKLSFKKIYVFLHKQIHGTMNVISIIGQKGGCGKTTMTILLASALAYKYGKKVVVLDCDTNQQSLVKIRQRDIRDITPYKTLKDGQEVHEVREYDIYMAYKKQSKQGIKPYDVVACEEKVAPIIEYLVKMDEQGCDYAFLDLPGNVDSDEYNQILSLCNIVFLPFIGDDLNFDSNFDFAMKSCLKVLKSKSNENLKKVYGYWSKYSSKVRPAEFRGYCEKVKNELPIVEMLENKFHFTNAVGNKYFMNTLVTPVKYADSGNLEGITSEMFNKIEEID